MPGRKLPESSHLFEAAVYFQAQRKKLCHKGTKKQDSRALPCGFFRGSSLFFQGTLPAPLSALPLPVVSFLQGQPSQTSCQAAGSRRFQVQAGPLGIVSRFLPVCPLLLHNNSWFLSLSSGQQKADRRFPSGESAVRSLFRSSQYLSHLDHVPERAVFHAHRIREGPGLRIAHPVIEAPCPLIPIDIGELKLMPSRASPSWQNQGPDPSTPEGTRSRPRPCGRAFSGF